MKCIKCGSVLDDNATYCPICGTILNQVEQDIKEETVINLDKDEKTNEPINEATKTKKYNIVGIIIVLFTIILLITLIYLTITGYKKQTAKIIENNYSVQSATDDLIMGDADLFSIAENVDFNISYDTFKNIVGYEGKLTSNNTYSFNGSLGEIMDISFNELSITSIEIEYNVDMLKSNKTDLINAESMKNKISEGLTISELLSTFGEDGYVIKRDDVSKTYAWVNTNGYEITAVIDSLGNVLEINI